MFGFLSSPFFFLVRFSVWDWITVHFYRSQFFFCIYCTNSCENFNVTKVYTCPLSTHSSHPDLIVRTIIYVRCNKYIGSYIYYLRACTVKSSSGTHTFDQQSTHLDQQFYHLPPTSTHNNHG